MRKECKLAGCSRQTRSRGMCIQHYRRLCKGDSQLLELEPDFQLKICSIEDCPRPVSGRGLCDPHRKRAVKYGDPNIRLHAEKGRGEWKHDGNGYMRANRPGHPNAAKDGAIHEHVFVMSEYLGRALLSGETVHHKNGIRHDNRIDNLELWVSAHPAGQ